MCESRIEELKGKARANCERKSTIQIVKKIHNSRVLAG